jgi:ribosomal protein S1
MSPPTDRNLAPRDGLTAGQLVRGTVVAHHRWGVDVDLDEAPVCGVVDLRFVSDDHRDMNEERFPPIGSRLAAKIQGWMPNGQLRLTLRRSDLDDPGYASRLRSLADEPPGT